MLTGYLPSLKYQCVRGDVIYIYKLVHNLIDMDPASSFTFQPSSITIEVTVLRYLNHMHALHLYRDATFSLRVINDWNELPEYI